MARPHLLFNENKLTFKYDKDYIIEEYHIHNILSDIFKHSFIPSFVKKRNVLFLGDSNRDSLDDDHFYIGFLDRDSDNKDIIKHFNSYDYRIIAGFDNEIKDIIQLESFFTHRTDMIILFNSDNMHLADDLRGTINAPVYMADFHSYNQIAYKTKTGQYRLNDSLNFKHIEGNLYSAGHDDLRYFLLDSKTNKILKDIFYYRKEHLHQFTLINGEPFYITPFTLQKEISQLDKHILDSSCSIAEDTLHLQIFIYEKQYSEKVRKEIEDYFNNMFEENKIRKYAFDITVDVF